jgi:hypothetical protein
MQRIEKLEFGAFDWDEAKDSAFWLSGRSISCKQPKRF